jgi:hypothetical protein
MLLSVLVRDVHSGLKKSPQANGRRSIASFSDADPSYTRASSMAGDLSSSQKHELSPWTERILQATAAADRRGRSDSDSSDSGRETTSVLLDACHMMTQSSTIWLILGFGFIVGSSYAAGTVLGDILLAVFPSLQLDSPTLVWVRVCASSSGVVGALCAGCILDRSCCCGTQSAAGRFKRAGVRYAALALFAAMCIVAQVLMQIELLPAPSVSPTASPSPLVPTSSAAPAPPREWSLSWCLFLGTAVCICVLAFAIAAFSVTLFEWLAVSTATSRKSSEIVGCGVLLSFAQLIAVFTLIG